jgi:serine phosphatase RsbU (regulator of sigma subunit)
VSRLLVTDQDSRASRFELSEERCHRIGRESDNDLVLSDPTLSRHHAEVTCEDGYWTVRDCGSSNGTFVNAERIQGPVRLAPGDRIVVGACTLEFNPLTESGSEISLSDLPLPPEGTLVLSPEELNVDLDTFDPDPAAMRAAMSAMRKRLEVVERANLELLGHQPLDSLLSRILDLVFEAIRPDRAALMSVDDDGELICRAYRATDTGPMTVSRTVARKVMEERTSIMTADAEHDERLGGGTSVFGIGSMMAVPLWNNIEVTGLIYVDSGGKECPFRADDLRLLTMLANVAAIQIENARLFEEHVEKVRFEEEVRAAAAVHRRLLPSQPPEIPGYTFHGKNVPCTEVGGDYYDCIPLEGGRFGIVVADVSGKGMGAALLMAGLHCAFRARAESAASPRDLVKQLDGDIMRSSPIDRYATFFYLELDPATHTGRWVNAGHAPPPMVVRAGGPMEELLPGGIPLGLPLSADYPVREIRLEPGDVVFACSDGVTEAESPDGEMFGEERLREFLGGVSGRSPEAIGEEIESLLRDHQADSPRFDDLTYVVIRRSSDG